MLQGLVLSRPPLSKMRQIYDVFTTAQVFVDQHQKIRNNILDGSPCESAKTVTNAATSGYRTYECYKNS